MGRKPDGVQEEPHKLTLFLSNIRPAFIGPAYSLNKYIDAYVEDIFWDDIKYEVDLEKRTSSSLRAISIIIEIEIKHLKPLFSNERHFHFQLL